MYFSPMPYTFRLYLLVNPQSLHDYPYIAMSAETDIVISICDEHISIAKRNDEVNLSEHDFILTSRSITVDIVKIFHLVELYMGTDDCYITARFTHDKHITLTHRVSRQGEFRDHDLFDTGLHTPEDIIVRKLLPIMEDIRRDVEDVDG
jgi:hypothetical protein